VCPGVNIVRLEVGMGASVSFKHSLGNPLEWSSTGKATLLFVIAVVMHAQYWWVATYLLSHPDRDILVNVEFLQDALWLFQLFTLLSLLFLVATPLCRRRYGDSRLYEYLATQYYALSLCYFSYVSGALSMPTGVVLAGAPVVGF